MRLCEVYTSVQGEGPNTGKPTTFVRFGGCNLRCPGWGTGTLPDGTEVPGCDTVFAVYPQWSSTWGKHSVSEIVSQIPSEPKRVCLTGGEPLTQPRKELDDLVFGLFHNDYTLDLFTNGSRPLGSHVWTGLDAVTVVMDWKLPGSGELNTFDVNNLSRLGEKDAIKFVIKDRHDFDTALENIEWAEKKRLLGHPFAAQVWFGPVWDHLLPNALTEWIQEEYPEGHLNIQTHKYIWNSEMRRV